MTQGFSVSGQNQQPLMNQQYSPQVPPSFRNDDEIDLRELFKALWEGKVIIIATTLIFAMCAAGYAFMTPNVYQAKSSFLFEQRFFNMPEMNEPEVSAELLSSRNFKKQLATRLGIDRTMLSSINTSQDKRSKAISISISQQSRDPKFAFERVLEVSNILNGVLKEQELSKVQTTLDALRANSENESLSAKSQDYLDELIAQQLFKKAMLQNPETEIVTVISPASLPTTHVKPKRALISVLGTLLGGMLGVAIVLVRFAFRREEDTQ